VDKDKPASEAAALADEAKQTAPAGVTTGTAAGQEPPPAPDEDPPTLTDTGNAARLVTDHGLDLRFCHPWGTWLCWIRTHWKEDDTGEVMRRGKRTLRSLLTWAIRKLAECPDLDPEDESTDGQRARLKAVVAWCLKSLAAPRRNAMIELARSELPILPAAMDRDGWLLNCRNGTLDLRTGQLRPHRREDYITRFCPVEFDPAALCPTWERCLRDWQPSTQQGDQTGNPRMIEFIQRAVGYSLTGEVSEQVFFFLYGEGANGKSVFLATILALLGDYAIQAIAELLLAKRGEAHPTERADLFGKRFVATIETEDGRRMAEALLKQLTGGDRIRARRMRQDFWEFSPTHKIWLAANHRPAIHGTDYAIWRRVKVLPFAATIPPEKRDPRLATKLRAELPGILAWAVRGCLAWQREGLGEPEEVTEATAAYRAEQDVVSAWLTECCLRGPNYRCRASALMASISAWCKIAGQAAPTQTAFGRRLSALGYESYTSNGTWYRGLAVRSEVMEGLEGTEPPSG
jgi:putative DNA primase/helicase